MSDNPTAVVPPIQPPYDILNKMKALAGEHFDDYLLVVCKDGDVLSCYKSKCSAFGMASMVASDIGHDWHVNRSKNI